MPMLDAFSLIFVRVNGSRGDFYVVSVLGDVPVSCTCPSFKYHTPETGEPCKHMKARAGDNAIGRTRCRHCTVWLTPEDISSAVAAEIPEGEYRCSHCPYPAS